MALPLTISCCQKIGYCRLYIAQRGLRRTAGVFQEVSTPRHDPTTAPPSAGLGDNAEIVIPKRKKRDELSILKALASTVKKDFHGPHYKYMDDPYLIPASPLEKRTYSLAKASGEKAANYVLQRFPGNFADNPAEPSIEAFMSPAETLSADSVAGLRQRIELQQAAAAFQSYQTLTDAGGEIEQEVLQDLLELLCVYNGDDTPERPSPEETFYVRSPPGQDSASRFRKTWKDSGVAEQLFKDMEKKEAKAYCALIRGRAKYLQVDKAFELFNEMKSIGLKADVPTFNALLEVVSFTTEEADARWQLSMDLLRDLASGGQRADLATFNSALYTLSRSSKYKETPQRMMQVINEMRRCDIEPSLASWYYIVVAFHWRDEIDTNILYDIVDQLENKEFSLRHKDDVEFFTSAMIKCFSNVKDMSLAYRIDAIVNYGNNAHLLGDSYRETLYYTHFMRLLCIFEQMDTIMSNYERITPHVYTPTFTTINELLRAIDLNESYEYLPKIWSDLVLFDYTRNEDLMEHLLTVMAKTAHSKELQQMLVKISANVVQKFADDAANERLMRPLVLTGSMIGNLILVNINGQELQVAWDVFNIYLKNKNQITGFPSETALSSLVEVCLVQKDSTRCLQVLSIMADLAYPKLDEHATKLQDDLELSEEQVSHLHELL